MTYRYYYEDGMWYLDAEFGTDDDFYEFHPDVTRRDTIEFEGRKYLFGYVSLYNACLRTADGYWQIDLIKYDMFGGVVPPPRYRRKELSEAGPSE